MAEIDLTNRQARRFLLSHQGLWPPYGLKGRAGILTYINRVGCIQFDPLDIVGRNPDLALQARIAGYHPDLLSGLLYETRELIDGWDKMMSIYPVADWPCFYRYRERARRRHEMEGRSIARILPQVRRALAERGPLSSRDLDYDQPVDWPWAPTRLARAALESMYFWGELIIHHKVHTRKVYDFARTHLPQALLDANDPNPTEEAYHEWRVKRRLGGIGLLWGKSGEAWLGMPEIKTPERRAALDRLLAKGEIIQAAVEGIVHPFYLRRGDWDRFASVPAAPAPRAAIIAPLDNLLWDRRLIKELFGFDYCWEVYKPVTERKYGYYVLPILYGDCFVARFEPGRDKKGGVVRIKKWWWEPDAAPDQKMRAAVTGCFERFLSYLAAKELQIEPAAREAGLDWNLTPLRNT